MQEFITIGRDNISKSLFEPAIQNEFNQSSKPSGGLWVTKHTDINCNHWLMYLTGRHSLFYNKFREKASILTLKDNAKVLYAELGDMENLKEKYPTNKGIIDYVKLSEDYDALFFNYRYSYEGTEFEDWCVPSMVIFNPDAIQSYRPVKVTYEYDPEFDFMFYLKDIEEERKVTDYDPEIENLYNDYRSAYTKENFENYDDLFKSVYTYSEEYFAKLKKDGNHHQMNIIESIFMHRVIHELCLKTNILEKENGLNL